MRGLVLEKSALRWILAAHDATRTDDAVNSNTSSLTRSREKRAPGYQAIRARAILERRGEVHFDAGANCLAVPARMSGITDGPNGATGSRLSEEHQENAPNLVSRFQPQDFF